MMNQSSFFISGKKPSSSEIALAQEIVRDWSRKKGRMLTQNETECLVSAIFLGVNNANHFDAILLGYKLRGEDNMREIRNVLNVMQELINGMIASQKDIMDTMTKLLEEIEAASIREKTRVQTLQIKEGGSAITPKQEGDTTDMCFAAPADSVLSS